MKKALLTLLALPLFCLFFALPACAQEAEDLTAQCTYEASYLKIYYGQMMDGDYHSYFSTEKQVNPYLICRAPEGKPMYGLYICFAEQLYPWQVEALHNGQWETVYTDENRFAHQYVPLNGEQAVRIMLTGRMQTALEIREMRVLGEGDLPRDIQVWQPTVGKADLMLVAAHPDDEILFFGGTIPYYAAELKKNVLVVYMTLEHYQRRSELLNGLWEMGVVNYPVINEFEDIPTDTAVQAFESWGGMRRANTFLVSLIREHQPEVIVTHDVNGEYGHGAHMACADMVPKCVKFALDKDYHPDSASAYGVWEVKKVYLHMAKENPVVLDWDIPLNAFDGRTGFEVAQAAFQMHVTQLKGMRYSSDTEQAEYFCVEPRTSSRSCYDFGLVYTTVGPDEACSDFLEHIE